MRQIHTTKEYVKCREELKKRGKIGKQVYTLVSTTEAEIGDGRELTIRRTHHGEGRIPDCDKYDLPGDYRLVVQRLEGKDEGCVFRFVGNHEDTERWIENNRDSRWRPEKRTHNTDSASALERRRTQQIQQELQDHKNLVQILEREKAKDKRDLADKDRALKEAEAQITSQVTKHEEALKQHEADRQRIVDQIRQQNEELANNSHLVEGKRREGEEKLARKSKELEEEEKRVIENKEMLAKYREQLIAFQQQTASENARILAENNLKERQSGELRVRVAQLEEELRSSRIWHRPWFIISAVASLLGFIAIILAAFAFLKAPAYTDNVREPSMRDVPPIPPKNPNTPKRDDPPNEKDQRKIPDKKSDSDTNVEKPKEPGVEKEKDKSLKHEKVSQIAIQDASKHVGKLRQIEMKVKSVAKKEDVLFLNSESDFRTPTNFAVLLSYKKAEPLLKSWKIASMPEGFKGKTIRVRGLVKKYMDKYELSVSDPKMVEILD